MLCDDEEIITNTVEKFILEYNHEKRCNEQIIIYKYNNPKILLEKYIKNEGNLLFLDIDMKPITGIQLSNKIREIDIKANIIFLTGFNQYMRDGFNIHAFDYLVKPITKEKLWKALDDYFEYKKREYKERDKHLLKYRTLNNDYCIDTDMIYYLEKYKNQLNLILEEKSITIYLTLSDALKQLPNNFFNCHKSFIVNVDKVIKRERDKCFLKNSIEIPIGRAKQNEFKDFYISYFDPFNKQGFIRTP